MYGTCETLCRELAVKYPGDMPLMLVIWSPEEIQALADGMDISLSDHEIRTVLARLEDIPEDQRTESGISSGVAMEIINNVSENRQVIVPAELLASLIQTAEQALWKREWAARDHGCASGCGFPCALCIPALSPGFYGGTAPPGVAEYVNNGGKHHAICETCHSER
ncbi:DUF1380 family protein [Escherichia coli]|uniref:DUF1380 family protein n=1 Tax=Escherichia coli TaxID=562 RepID=UPI00387E5986